MSIISPVSGVGLTGDIVQFVDFACKLFSASHQIRTSEGGVANDLESVEIVTEDLRKLCEALTTSLTLDARLAQDGHIACLGSHCVQIAERLLATIAALKPKKHSSRWSCFQAAWKTIWKQDEIDRMMLQLNGLRMELMLRMQFTGQPEVRVVARINQVANEIRDTAATLAGGIDGLRNEMSRLAQQHRRQALENDPKETVDGQNYDLLAQEFSLQAAELTGLSSQENYLPDMIKLLKSLYFEGLQYRYSKVSKAHAKTYEWAYEHCFAQFLQSAQPLFWVSGKPGSGKSTFMKFLVNKPQTAAYLSDWAGPKIVVTSSYFFWVNGSAMQRSQEGLLRSILLDLLLQCPALRSTALEHAKELGRLRWDPSCGLMLGNTWDLSGLSKLLMLMLAESSSLYCCCLFIDGLDEYDGEFQDLNDVLVSLKRFPNVKLCVAGRPLNEFEDTFGSNQQHKIYMQHLTSVDIKIFAKDKLEQNSAFTRMQGEGAGVGELISEITDKAQGVFLWVRLVVHSLLRGLQNADRIIDLRRRLAEYPQDLDEFFRYILGSLEPIYRAQIAQGFRAAQTAPRPPTVLQFWYMDHEDEDPDYATNAVLCSTYAPGLLKGLRQRDGQRAVDMTKRITGRFKGLLEVTNESCGRTYLTEDGDPIYEMRVDFLHRTVKDFLATKESHALIQSWIPTTFNVYKSLYKAYLADLKDACARPECVINSSTLRELVEDLFRARAGHEAHTGDRLERLSQELLTVSRTRTPSYYGTTLEKLLGKSFFSQASYEVYRASLRLEFTHDSTPGGMMT